MTKRRSPLFLSFAFLLSSLALWSQANRYFETPEAPAPVAVVSQQQPTRVSQEQPTCTRFRVVESQTMEIDGVWEQYSIEEGGERVFMARLRVDKDGTDYLATPVEISENTFPKHTYRSYDHTFNNGVWTFREDWDNGEVGEFALELQPNGDYRGTARHAGSEYGFETVYVKVGK